MNENKKKAETIGTQFLARTSAQRKAQLTNSTTSKPKKSRARYQMEWFERTGAIKLSVSVYRKDGEAHELLTELRNSGVSVHQFVKELLIQEARRRKAAR